MRYTFVVFMVLFAFVFAGCGASGIAGFRVTQDGYRVAGATVTPERMVSAASDAYVRTSYAQTYDYAVRNGMAIPYEGGYYGTDMGYFYGGVAPTVAPRQGYIPGGDAPATVEQVEMVRDRADEAHDAAIDGLRLHQQHRDYHRGGGR